MFAGLISREQPVSAWGDATKIMAALAPCSLDGPRDHWAAGRQMLLQVNTRSAADSAAIHQHPESGVAVAFWGRLDNRPDLIRQLDAGHKASDDELVALAWLQWGERCPEKLIGDFAFAVASPRTGCIFLARDVMGVKPLFYRADEHGVFFASTAAAFKPLELGALTRSQKWMAEYLLGLSHSHTETAYVEIKKLPGAHCLLLHADGRMSLRRYHQFIDDAPFEKKRDPKYLEAYRAAWQEAVACRMPASGNIGAENSGGLDSGSITAELARVLGADIDRLFGMGFCYEALEPGYIMATAMKYRMKNTRIFSHDLSGNWHDNLLRENSVHGYPHELGSASSHTPFYAHCAQQDIGVLYSGFGGDEAVTNPGGVPVRLELWDQRHLAGLWQILPGAMPMKLARLAKTVKTSWNMPKNHAGFMAAWKQRWPYQFLNARMLEQYGLENRYFASATYDERFRRINDAAIYLLSRPYAPIRLQNCTLMAASYGIDYVWPLWDSRLVQQWLSTPSIWKVGDNGMGRYLHRRAVSGTAADAVAWKQSKDMGCGALQKNAEPTASRELLERLRNLLAAVPVDLQDVVDSAKALTMLENGIREDWRDREVIAALSTNIHALEKLTRWIKSDVS